MWQFDIFRAFLDTMFGLFQIEKSPRITTYKGEGSPVINVYNTWLHQTTLKLDARLPLYPLAL